MYDTTWATKSDLVIYISPSGTDAWAEVGAAFAANVPVWGLWAKGEQVGLMRKMVSPWFYEYRELLDALKFAVEMKLRPEDIKPPLRFPRVATAEDLVVIDNGE